MKQLIVVLLLVSIGLAATARGQSMVAGDSPSTARIEISLARWKAKYLVAKSVLDSADRFEYHFRTSGDHVQRIFSSREVCVEQLNAWPSDSLQSFREVNAFVRVAFSDSTAITFHVDEHGGYYFNGRWHLRNDVMYWALFQFFSDELVPSAILQEAKEAANGR